MKKKLMEAVVSATVVILIAAPVVAGVYVGIASDKASHGPHKGSAEGEVEAGHGAEPAAGSTAGGHAPQPGTTPDHPKEPEYGQVDPSVVVKCGYQDLVGQKVEAAEAKLRAAHKIYRKVKPGSPLTMDYSADRFNLDLDDHGVVTRVWCG